MKDFKTNKLQFRLSGRRFFQAALIGLALVTAPQAQATSGSGCLYVVNVSSWDVLNMRAWRSAKSRIVDRLRPNAHGIIHLDSQCLPLSRSWGNRWCPVTHYNGNRVRSGWVKARYVRDSDCP